MTLLRLLPLAFVLLTVALGRPAFAADPQCVPGDPLFETPFDPATGDYVRPNRDIRFCSSAIPENLTSQADLVCTVVVDGVPYVQATRKQRELIEFSNPVVAAGEMTATCVLQGIDENGDPTQLASLPAVVDYNPVPEPQAPVPLD